MLIVSTCFFFSFFSAVPCSPINVSASLVCSDYSALVTWVGTPTAVGYNVTAIGQDGHTSFCYTSTTSCLVPDIQCGQTYNITVTPYSETCIGNPSAIYSLTAGNYRLNIHIFQNISDDKNSVQPTCIHFCSRSLCSQWCHCVSSLWGQHCLLVYCTGGTDVHSKCNRKWWKHSNLLLKLLQLMQFHWPPVWANVYCYCCNSGQGLLEQAKPSSESENRWEKIG